MKKSKYLNLLILFLCLIFTTLLTGCETNTAISQEQFMTFLETKNYTLHEDTSAFSELDYITQAQEVIIDDSISIRLLQVDTDANAGTLFTAILDYIDEDQKKQEEQAHNISVLSSEKKAFSCFIASCNLDDYGECYYEINDEYTLVYRVNNIILYGKCDSSMRPELENLLEECFSFEEIRESSLRKSLLREIAS